MGSKATVPATELELEAQLKAARAEINALKEREKMLLHGPSADDDARNKLYRRLPAELWEQPILQD